MAVRERIAAFVVLAALTVAGVAARDFCEACGDAAAGALHSNGTQTAEPFSLRDVKLLSGTKEWRAQQLNLEYMLMLPVRSLAYNFLNTSGLPLDGAQPLGGWETPYGPLGDDRGHFTGHFLSASAMMIQSTGNATLASRATELVDILFECQEANAKKFPEYGPGYLSGFPTHYFDCLENLWRSPCRYMQVPYYNVHKIMQGLLDQHVLLGNTKALTMVESMAAYFGRRIDHVLATNGTSTWNAILNTESGGMNDVLYQLYSITRNASYVRLAHLFDKQAWFGPILNHTDILANHHANTHLALTVGGATRSDVLNDKQYADAVQFFASTLSSAHSYSTGGSNYREYWQEAHQQGSSLLSSADSYAGHDNEESCTTYNFLKILRYLFRWSTSPSIMQIYSHAITNGVMGIQGNNPGVMVYLLPLGRGVTKGNSSRGWGTPMNSFWCCYGTGIESFSKLADSIYFRSTSDVDTLYVVRYVSSELRWNLSHGSLNLQQVAEYGSERSKLTITQHDGTSMHVGIFLRIPSWAGLDAMVTVNGVQNGPVQNGTWHKIFRKWVGGDTIEVVFPAAITLVKLDDNRSAYEGEYSFVVGDTVLVGIESEYNASNVLVVPSLDPTGWVRRQPGEDLKFTATVSNRVLELMPLNNVVNERYTVYYRLITRS